MSLKKMYFMFIVPAVLFFGCAKEDENILLLSQANLNAYHVYDSAVGYFLESEITGISADDGEYVFSLDKEAPDEGLEAFVCQEHAILGGSVRIEVKGGTVLYAVWSPSEGDISPSGTGIAALDGKDIENGEYFGRYPKEVLYNKKDGTIVMPDPSKSLYDANSTAEKAYNAAAYYCTLCESAGYTVQDGWYCFDISGEVGTDFRTDGGDLAAAIGSQMGNYGGYAAVRIESMMPRAVLWSPAAVIDHSRAEVLLSVQSYSPEDGRDELFGRYPVPVVLYEKGTLKDTRSGDERLVQAQENAKTAFTNAYTYSTICEVNGGYVPDGWHFFALDPSLYNTDSYAKDGSGIKNAISSFMGDCGGYCAVYVENGYPTECFWSEDTDFSTVYIEHYRGISPDEQNIFGRYVYDEKS